MENRGDTLAATAVYHNVLLQPAHHMERKAETKVRQANMTVRNQELDMSMQNWTKRMFSASLQC